LISTGKVLTIGSPTHGNLSGEEVYAVLPCGLVMRISNAYICDAKGRIIERNGNIPDIYAESSIQDIIAGRDAVLERAALELDRLCGK
jgi:C-terminal processing protease CtpA/Prc